MPMPRTTGTDLPDRVYDSDLQEWLRTRSPFTRDEARRRLMPDRLRFERPDTPVDPNFPAGGPWVRGPDLSVRARRGAGTAGKKDAEAPSDEEVAKQREELARRARIMRDEMRADPSESIPAWIMDFPRQETVLQSLVNRGKYAEAREFYDGLRKAVDDNYDAILRMTEMGWMGPDGERLAALAKRVVNDEYLNTETRLVDGSATTLGALVRDGGQIAIEAARDEFDALGLPEDTAELMFNGSGQQRALLKALTKPLLAGGGVTDRQQRVDLIDTVVSRWDELEGTFGEGTAYLVQRMQDLHNGFGGAPAVLKTMTSIANNLRATRGLEGRDLVREVCGSYSDFVSAMFRGSSQDGKPIESIPVMDRLCLDSALSSAVQEMDRRGAAVDLRSPVFMNSMLEAMDLTAYGLAAGVDLVGVGRAAGRALPQAIAGYVADGMTLDENARDPANPVQKLRNLRSLLDNQIRGGNDFAEEAYRMTGSSADYLASISRGVKGYSSSPGADALSDAMRKHMFRTLAPMLVAGQSFEDAVASGVRDGSLAQGLADKVFTPYLAGPGAADAAMALANTVVGKFAEGRADTLQDTILDLAFGPGSGLDEFATTSLRNWYNGNVSQAVRYAQYSGDLMAHLQADEQLPAQKAAAMSSRVRSEAAALERLGQDPAKAYEAAIAQGTVYAIAPGDLVPGTNNPRLFNPITGEDDAKGLPRVSRVVKDRRMIGWQYGGDNSQYEGFQREMKHMYDQWQTVRDNYYRGAAGAMVKQDYADL